MNNLKQLVKISRPRFWVYLLGPFLVGAAAAGLDDMKKNVAKLVVFGLMFTLPANLLIYGINDIFDFETDKLNPKKQGYEVLVRPSYHKTLWYAFGLTFLIPVVVIGQFLKIPTQAWAALASFVFFGAFYSSKPIRAKTKPGLDMLFNCLYVFPGVFSYALLTGNFGKPELFAAGVLWCMAMHAYSAVPDIKADKLAGLSTVATWLGKNNTLRLCVGMYVVSAALSFGALGVFSVVLGAVYVGMMLISLRTKNAAELMNIYKSFPRVNTLAGFGLFWVVVLRG
jgi:lycopene elongase/hydratase (dihydrobisanhydrobacterioruberin-forming)